MSNLELTYQNFVSRISSTARKDISVRLTKRALITLSSFVIIALIAVSLEAIFNFSSPVRKIIFFGYLSALFATSAVILAFLYSEYSALRSEDKINYYAGKIGGFFPDIKDNLANALQIYRSAKQKNKLFSQELAAESISLVNIRTEGVNFTSIISYNSDKPYALILTGSIILSLILFAVFPSTFNASVYRLVNYNYTFIENTLGIAYEVSPGNVEISKGESVKVNAKILFNDPHYKTEEIILLTKTLSAEGVELSANSQKISSISQNQFETILSNINSNTSYRFEYKGIKSEEYKISITSRPVIKNVKITVYPPAYTKLPSRIIDGNEIYTIAGSKIYVELDASDDLSKSLLVFNSGSEMQMELNGKNAVGSFNASANGSFKLNIFKDFGNKEISNSNPQDYTVRVYPDEYPKINIIEPEGETQASNTKEVLLRSRITDDFGFTKMRLAYKLAKSKYSPPDKDYRFKDISIVNTDATGLEVPYQWNLADLNPGTEDEIEYFVVVYDNDAVSGPKMSRSEIRKLVFPSLEALLNKTEKTKDEIENSLKSAYEDAMELKQELDELKEKLEKNPEELGLNDPHKNQELQNKIQNIQNQFSATQQQLDELMKELQNNNQISQETLEKYMELQKMFEQIDSKELREMLKKLQEAMKNMNPDQLKEAMKNFHFDEESFKKSMEKTMELLQKILNEQKFGELTKKLDEITKEQDKIKEQTQNTDKNDKEKMNELSKSQEQLKKEFEEFQKQMKELIENMKKLKNDGISKELEKMLQEMQKKNLENMMNESSQNLQQGNKNQSQKNQQQLSEDLNQMNRMMQDILAQMLNEENSKLMAKMQEILNQLEEMSKKQGELKEQSKELDKESDPKEFQQNAKQQDELAEQLSNAIDQLMGLSQQMPMTPQMMKSLGDAYNHMKDASESLQGKDGESGNMSQGKAKESLDKAIEKMQSMCQGGQKPGNSSSLSQLLQGLQQLIARQQALNDKMGQIGPPNNMGQYSQEQMSQMQKLAVEQETLKKNLQQLNEEFKKQQETEGKKLLGNLDQVQKDMMEIVKDLMDNNISPETKKRQEKILSRMLDFQLSAREKDFEKRRESRPGKDFDRTSPPEIIISKPTIIDGINQDALELQKESYSEDYEVLIQKYMEKIKAVQKEY